MQCVSTGSAEVNIVLVKTGNPPSSVRLNTAGGTDFPDQANYLNYTIRITELQPPPTSGSPIAQVDYKAKFLISKQNDSSNNPPYQLSSLDAQCGDQTAAGLLSHVKAQYDAALKTLPAFSSLLTDTAVTIRVAYQGGTLTCYPANSPPPGTTIPQLSNEIGIVSHVKYLTAGGAFQEEFDTELKGRSDGSTGWVEFSHNFNVEDIHGTYRPDLPGYIGQFVSIGGRLSDESTHGSIAQGGQRPGFVSSIEFVAEWDSN